MKTRLTSSFPRATMTLLVMLLSTTMAWADDSGSCGTNVTYSYVESTHTLTISGTGAMANYNSSSDWPWYSYRADITSVVIEDGVTTIGNYAFRECNNAGFTSINIPASVESIGEDAFNGCSGVTTVTFAPNSQLTRIDNFAFYCCDNAEFTSITIPASVEYIGNSAFINCSKLASITFAEVSHLTTIDFQAFNGTAISSITIPASVTSIGSYVFGDCQNLTSINVEAGNTNYSSEGGVLLNKDKTTLIQYPIGNTASSYTIPYGVTTIDDNAFDGCTSLRSVNIPASVTSIGNYSFYSAGLTSVTIPANVTSIGSEAFEGCDDLSLVYVLRSESVPTLGNNAFSYCANNLVIYVPNGSLVNYIGANKWKNLSLQELTANGNCGTAGHESEVFWYIVNNTLTISGNGAMTDYANDYNQPWKNYRTNITSLVIESGVTHIANKAFDSCSSLATVTFAAGSQLTTIGNNAFYNCSGLTTIAIPSGVTTIGNSAFYNCSGLTTIAIPSGVTSIGNDAFKYCNSMTSFNVEAGNTNYSSDGGVLFNYDKTTLLLYPRGNTASSYTIPASVETIGQKAFRDNNKLTSVTISNGVKDINEDAFYSCGKLTSVTISASVETIGRNAFNNCTKLATVAFAPCSQLNKIDESAFYKCQALTSITIPGSVEDIGGNAFKDCTKLASVTIYNPTVTALSTDIFRNNKSGRKIYVFSNCVDSYKSRSQFSDYTNDIEPIPDLTVKAADDSDASKGKWCTYYNGLANVTVADGTTIYKAAFDKSTNNVTLTPVDGQIIKMGEAVLLKSDADIVLLGSKDANPENYTDNDLHGVDYATPLADLGANTDTYYVLGNKNGHFGFHKYTGTNMPANKAYLRISGDGNALAPTLDINWTDNETTGISEIAKSQESKANGLMFDLQGRKVAQPTKGMYIVNGKKLIVK